MEVCALSLTLLIDHPKTFLKTNAVWIHGSLNVAVQGKPQVNANGVGKVFPVEMRSATGKSCVDKAGRNMPCWEIVETKVFSKLGTLAYYLPYEQNKTKSMLLGSNAKLFLTDTINGCTFAASTGGQPLVSHLNYTAGRQEGTSIDQDA